MQSRISYFGKWAKDSETSWRVGTKKNQTLRERETPTT